MVYNFFENEKGFSRLVIVYLCVLLWAVTFRTFDVVMELDFRGRDTAHIVALAGIVQSTTTLALGYVFKWYVIYRKEGDK